MRYHKEKKIKDTKRFIERKNSACNKSSSYSTKMGLTSDSFLLYGNQFVQYKVLIATYVLNRIVVALFSVIDCTPSCD